VTQRGEDFAFFTSPPRNIGGEGAASDGAILSPMPGRVVSLDVVAGDIVTAGQKLMVIEAMKMEHSIIAPFDGKVNEIGTSLNEQVASDALLIQIEHSELEQE